MLVLGLLGEKKDRKLQINCISCLLTIPSFSWTLSFTLICQQFASKVVIFPGARRDLYACSPKVCLSALVAFLAPPASGSCDQTFAPGNASDWSFVCVLDWKWKLFLREGVSADVVGEVANRFAGEGTLCCQRIAKTGPPFGQNFSTEKVKIVALDNLGIEVER